MHTISMKLQYMYIRKKNKNIKIATNMDSSYERISGQQIFKKNVINKFIYAFSNMDSLNSLIIMTMRKWRIAIK